MGKTSAIIVTHDSGAVLDHCLRALRQASGKRISVVIVDSGSPDKRYLKEAAGGGEITVIQSTNTGYGRANNLGWQRLDSRTEFVLFLNPDAFPTPGSVERAINYLARTPDVAAVGGKLLGFDLSRSDTTGKIDSTGIFRTWYGRWHDRGQGQPDNGQYDTVQDVAAICGAFFICRRAALEQVRLEQGVVFDPDFFLYKEDIELCLRLRRAGWRLVYLPDVVVHHCRGWRKRRDTSRSLRLTAASSELILYRKHPSPYILWALLKYVLVRVLNL